MNVNSSKEDFIRYVSDFDKNPRGGDSISRRLLEGEYKFKGWHGRVLIDGDKAYKLNPVILPNNLKHPKKLFFSVVYLQNIICLLLESIISSNYPKLNNRYVKLIDAYKYEGQAISIYETCNMSTVAELIKDNIYNPKHLDLQLVRSIYQMSQVIGVMYNNHGFIHNDLKTNNVLIHKTEEGRIDFKMADFDSSLILLDKVEIRQNREADGTKDVRQSFRNREDDFYVIDRKSSWESMEWEIEGKLFRGSSSKYINIDIYTYILSILFNKTTIKIIDELPMLNQIASYIFTERDIGLIRKVMDNPKRLPNGIYGPIHHIISKKMKLRHHIYEKIEEVVKYLEIEFSEELTN